MESLRNKPNEWPKTAKGMMESICMKPTAEIHKSAEKEKHN